MKRVVLLGSTGSIGQSTLKAAADLHGEIRLVGLAARSRIDELAQQARAVKPKAVAIYEHSAPIIKADRWAREEARRWC